MCIIIYTPNGYIPKKHLNESLSHNDDGWGIMWPENGTLQVCTGLTKSSFFKEWKWIGKIKAAKVFHARIGTHGTNGIENCHPFAVPGHEHLAVAHNGILYRHSGGLNDDVSDTRHFVDDVLAKLPQGFLKHEGILTMLSDYIGTSKLAFMDGNGDCTIINSKLGQWNEDRWYSNGSYMGYRLATTYTPTLTTRYYPAHNATGAIGFHKDDKAVVQQNFPVFKEDEMHAYGQPGMNSRDYDAMSDQEWQEMIESRHKEYDKANAASVATISTPATTSCGIGIPSAVMGRADAVKTGVATLEDLAQNQRRRRVDELRAAIQSRYPEDSPGAREWRLQHSEEYPCRLPDPLSKYNGGGCFD